MWHRTVFVRLSLGLVFLTCSILLGLELVGLVPSAETPAVRERTRVLESLAMNTAAAARSGDYVGIRGVMDALVREHDEVLSAGLRTQHGRLLVATARHRRVWQPPPDGESTLTHSRVPLTRNGEPWSYVEVRFAEIEAPGVLASLWERPLIRLLIIFSALSFVAFLFYLKRSLRHLDPSAVIPPRVQATLDLMAEGVMLLDGNERIVLVNSALAEKVGAGPEALMGLRASELDWRIPGSEEAAREFPWVRSLQDSSVDSGTALCLPTESGEVRTFMVKSAPIGEESGRVRGVIATFDDITALERKSEELEQALTLLEKSRDEIRLQNEELQVLARCDPLTGASNRRSFMERSEAEFAAASHADRDLCCLMADIDFFKRVNDDHGHAVGDEVIRRVAEALLSESPDREAVCRYGGEEFCVLLVGMDVERAYAIAERLRRSIAADGFTRVPVTASFGIATRRDGADSLYELINQADEALYVSKNSGRNRVTRWRADPAAAHD